MRLLREKSKEYHPLGYRIEWQSVNSTRFGKNEFPERIFIDTCEDYFFLIGKKNEFRRLVSVVTKIRESFPELIDSISSQLSVIHRLADDIEPLISLLKYFRDNPKPNCFLSEIPAVGVHTKFIERSKIKTILRQWLDVILPAWAIRSDEHHFERRYFLRYDEPLIRVHFLDTTLQQSLGFPCSYVAIPLHTFGHWDIQGIRVIVVENKISLLTLPALQNTIAIGGLGNAVTLLKYAPWLRHTRLVYWGDLDSDGLGMLSHLRKIYSEVQSVLMDAETLNRFSSLLTQGNGRKIETPSMLNESESAAFFRCCDENIRLEQERIPLQAVNEILTAQD
jgi:hypothetical protein